MDESIAIEQPLSSDVTKAYGGFEQLLNARILVRPPKELLEHLDKLKGSKPTESPAINPSTPSETSPFKQKKQSAQSTPLPNETNKEVLNGTTLKALRTTKGLTQSSLAALTGKSLSWVKQVETGRRNIAPDDRLRLLEILQ